MKACRSVAIRFTSPVGSKLGGQCYLSGESNEGLRHGYNYPQLHMHLTHCTMGVY
jgi:hypothetical protein